MLQSLIGDIIVIAIFAVVGIGIGVLVRNQIAAVIGTLVYLFVLEPLIKIIPVIQNAYPYLPGAAAAAITGATRGAGTRRARPRSRAVSSCSAGVCCSPSPAGSSRSAATSPRAGSASGDDRRGGRRVAGAGVGA